MGPFSTSKFLSDRFNSEIGMPEEPTRHAADKNSNIETSKSRKWTCRATNAQAPRKRPQMPLLRKAKTLVIAEVVAAGHFASLEETVGSGQRTKSGLGHGLGVAQARTRVGGRHRLDLNRFWSLFS